MYFRFYEIICHVEGELKGEHNHRTASLKIREPEQGQGLKGQKEGTKSGDICW